MSLLVLSCFKPRACCSAACFVATEKLPARRVENIHAPPEARGPPRVRCPQEVRAAESRRLGAKGGAR
jgi:hypothetical protein